MLEVLELFHGRSLFCDVSLDSVLGLSATTAGVTPLVDGTAVDVLICVVL